MPPDKTHLPRPLTRFIGRVSDLAALRAALRENRLVTILGPPGSGKTRLALEYALRLSAEAPGCGVWFCDLTEARGLEGVCRVLSGALEVPLGAGGPSEAVAQLGAVLRARGRSLLLLDNFEHLLDVAPALGRWLAAAPAARFLVTSRARLRLEGEVLFDLPPLSVPGPSCAPEASEAVALFLDRAQAVRRGYLPDERDSLLIAELVRRLDGLPLAIELAAARMRLLRPAQILGNLDQRFRLLTTRGGEGSSRQATLERAIEWSWEQLRPWEQAALAQCTLFRGGFSLEAAQAVIDLSRYPEAPWTLDVLEDLCDKSLIYREESDTARFALYQSIRDFAALRLGEDEAGARARHAAYFLDEGARFAQQLERHHGQKARLWLSREMENLLQVYRGAMRPPHTDAGVTRALAVALALSPILYARGFLELNLTLLDDALCAVRQDQASELLARAYNARGYAYYFLGRMAESVSDYERALRLAREADAPEALVNALRQLSFFSFREGRLDEARSQCQTALAVDAAHHLGWAGRILEQLAIAEKHHGHLEVARRHLEAARPHHREIGNRLWEGYNLASLAGVLHDLGRLDEAHTALTEAIACHREIGNRRAEGVALGNLATLKQEQGDLAGAEASLTAALTIMQEMAYRLPEGVFWGYLAMCLQEAEQPRRARECYQTALSICREIKESLYEGLFLACLGSLLAEEDEGAASESLCAAEAVLTRVKNAPFLEVLALCRGHLDLARARAKEEAGEREEARAHREEVARRLAQGVGAQGVVPRYARRLLRKALQRVGAPPPAPGDGKLATVGPAQSPHAVAGSVASGVSRPAAPAEAFRLSSSGRWFSLPGGPKVSLARRRALRLLCARLLAQRLAHPGAPLSLKELIKSGWPGERMTLEAGRSRIYTAVFTLKKLGLGDLLVHREDGYLFDPEVPILTSDDR